MLTQGIWDWEEAGAAHRYAAFLMDGQENWQFEAFNTALFLLRKIVEAGPTGGPHRWLVLFDEITDLSTSVEYMQARRDFTKGWESSKIGISKGYPTVPNVNATRYYGFESTNVPGYAHSAGGFGYEGEYGEQVYVTLREAFLARPSLLVHYPDLPDPKTDLRTPSGLIQSERYYGYYFSLPNRKASGPYEKKELIWAIKVYMREVLGLPCKQEWFVELEKMLQ